jgi:hypothetical protein
MIKVKIVPCEPTDPPKVYGGEDLRALLRGNSEFKVMWIGGVRYEMDEDGEVTRTIAQHAVYGPCLCGETHAPAPKETP